MLGATKNPACASAPPKRCSSPASSSLTQARPVAVSRANARSSVATAVATAPASCAERHRQAAEDHGQPAEPRHEPSCRAHHPAHDGPGQELQLDDHPKQAGRSDHPPPVADQEVAVRDLGRGFFAGRDEAMRGLEIVGVQRLVPP
jgi:hypothetical protein